MLPIDSAFQIVFPFPVFKISNFTWMDFHLGIILQTDISWEYSLGCFLKK